MRVDGALVFISASVAARVAPMPQITRVPGAPQDLIGIALHEDDLVPVIAVGQGAEAMVVCNHSGERLGLVGGKVVGAGLFDPAGDAGVSFNGETIAPLDLAALYARLRGERWGGRWGAVGGGA
jgi:hypothetical protein